MKYILYFTRIAFQRLGYSLTIGTILFTWIVIVLFPASVYGDTITSTSPLNLRTSDLNASNVHMDLSNPNRPELICANATFLSLSFSIQAAGGTQTIGTSSVISASNVSIAVGSTTALTGMLSPYVNQADMKTLLNGGTLANVDMKNVQWSIEQFLSTGQISVPKLTVSTF